MKRYCFALDLKNDQKSIDEYQQYHENVWPEIKRSILEAGILELEIYLTGNRLFMIMDTKDTFSLAEKNKLDASNSKVQEWEELMWKCQQALPSAKSGEKWQLMELVYSLQEN